MKKLQAKDTLDQLSESPNFPAIETAYLIQLKERHRARARRALRWRPRFLSALSASCSFTFSARAAKISYNTFLLHQRNDPEFARQVAEAEEQAAELLHDACFASALEGDVEDVYWQGIRVGHFRKFDTRLRIEMLRAHLPDRFKRDGANVNVHNGPGSSVLVIGPAEQQELIAARRASLLRLKAAHDAGDQPLCPIADEPAPPAGGVNPNSARGRTG